MTSPGRSASSIAASGASGLTVAFPVRSNVPRASASVNSRAIDSSGCVRGGTGRVASRLMTSTSGWLARRRAERVEQVASASARPRRARTSCVACASRRRISAKPTGIGLAEQVRAVVVRLHDADRERVERAARERDRLARRGARRAVERDVHRVAAVERQLRVRDVAVAPAVERLHEVDVVGRDRRRRGRPRCAGRARRRSACVRHAVVGIAVERGRGPVLGRVRVRVAVRGRGDALARRRRRSS